MTTLVIQPSSSDTEIDSYYTTTNYGTETTVRLHPESFAPHRGLVTFDLSGIPGGVTVTSAVLSLYFTAHAVDGTIYAHRIIRSWVETEATHIKATASVDWATAGCENTTTDRSSTVMGSTAISGTGWLDISLDLTEFASMLASNKGIRLSKTVSASYDYSTFASRENATSGNRPKLTVIYGTNYPQSVSGALTFSGGVTKNIGKMLVGALTFSGTLVKTVGKVVSGALTLSGSVNKAISRALSGALAPSGTLTKNINKQVSGALTFSGSLIKNIGKALSGALTFVGSLVGIGIYPKKLHFRARDTSLMYNQRDTTLTFRPHDTNLTYEERND